MIKKESSGHEALLRWCGISSSRVSIENYPHIALQTLHVRMLEGVCMWLVPARASDVSTHAWLGFMQGIH